MTKRKEKQADEKNTAQEFPRIQFTSIARVLRVVVIDRGCLPLGPLRNCWNKKGINRDTTELRAARPLLPSQVNLQVVTL